jgi:Heterokaryon incompatibility protein (HET)
MSKPQCQGYDLLIQDRSREETYLKRFHFPEKGLSNLPPFWRIWSTDVLNDSSHVALASQDQHTKMSTRLPKGIPTRLAKRAKLRSRKIPLTDEGLYEPLASTSKKIRLMTLEAGKLSDLWQISCRLTAVDLDKAPDFFALSYVWGEPRMEYFIMLNGQKFGVTENLFVALYHIRKVFRKIPIWIDAVCIDQRNPSEKMHQVGLMGEVYKQATRVIAWLGPKTEDSSLAIKMFQKCYSAARGLDPGDFSWVDRVPHLRYELNSVPTLTAVWRFGNLRPFWKRVWILQEFVLARDLLLMCGNSFFKPECLLPLLRLYDGPTATWCSESNHTVFRKLSDLHRTDWTTILWMFNLRYSSRFLNHNITSLVQFAIEFEASDPRDKIYALQGLATDGLPADYEMDVDQLYLNFAKKWLTERNDLSILISAALTSNWWDEKRHIATWIPRWGNNIAPPHFGQRTVAIDKFVKHYRAHGSTMPRFRMSEDNRVLWVTGVRLTSVPQDGGFLVGDWGMGMGFLSDFGLGDYLEAQSTKGLYPSGISRAHAFFQSLYIGVDPTTETALDPKSQSYAELASHFWGLAYHFHRPASWGLGYRYQELASRRDQHFAVLDELIEPYLSDLARRRPTGTMNTGAGVERENLTRIFMQYRSLKEESERPFRYAMSRIGLRHICLTADGYLATACSDVKAGDLICILSGLSMPVILRPVWLSGHNRFRFIGFCFVAGVMNGEFIEKVRDEVEEFALM